MDLLRITWYLIYYCDILRTGPMNWFILEGQRDLLDLLAPACGLIVRINTS